MSGSGREVAPPGWPAPPRTDTSGTGVVVVGVLLGLVAGAVNALFSFGMIFATDSCGTGAPGGQAAVCNGGVWLLVVALPWLGLLGGAIGTGLVARALRRQGRPAWPALAVGVGAYGVLLVLSLAIVFG